MNKLLILSKKSCGPCQALKMFINTLNDECQEKVKIISDETVTLNELYEEMKKVESYAFPTLVLISDDSSKIVNGFGAQTALLIKNHLSCF
jgi:hypothetical protein